MKKTIINQTEAIALLKSMKSLADYKVKFDSTKVEALDVILLGKNGVKVPSKLIWYDDDAIDFSDIPELTDEDLKSGRIKWIQKVEIPLHNDIRAWIKKERIDLSELLENLITDFYKNVKSIPDSNPKPAPKKRKKASV